MAEARRAPPYEDLLLERERRGVRTLTLVRGLFVLIVVATVWVVGASLFEKIATTVIAVMETAAPTKSANTGRGVRTSAQVS